MASSEVLPVSPSRLPCSTTGSNPSSASILHRKILSSGKGDRVSTSLQSSPQHQPQIGFKVRAKYDVTPPPTQCRAFARLVSAPGATPSGPGDAMAANGSALRRLPLLGQKLLKHRLSEPMLLPELKTMKEPVSVDVVGGGLTQECELIAGRHRVDAAAAMQQLTVPAILTSAAGGGGMHISPSAPITPAGADSTKDRASSGINKGEHQQQQHHETINRSSSSSSGADQILTDSPSVSGKTSSASGEAISNKSASPAGASTEPLEKLVRALQQRCKEQQAAIFALSLKSQASASELEQFKRRRGSELLHLSAQLYWLESNLRKEQQRLKWRVESRDRTIHMQHRTIHQLTQQLKDKQGSRSCPSCAAKGVAASPDSIQIEIIDASSSSSSSKSSSSADKNATDDDSAVVMDEDCVGDCTTGSTSSSGSSRDSSTSFLPRVPPSIMRSVSDALECACVQNYDARRHSSPTSSAHSHENNNHNRISGSTTSLSNSSMLSNTAAVRRGSLKHNMDHPFNSYLRKPEVLETVYSVDEETEDADAGASNGHHHQEHQKEQQHNNHKQPHAGVNFTGSKPVRPSSTQRQHSVDGSSSTTSHKGSVATNNGVYRRAISHHEGGGGGGSGGGVAFDSLSLARSDSCEWSLKSSASVASSRHAHAGRSHSSSPAAALMHRLRPKKYFGSCDNVALAMMSERMSSYKPKSMENLMHAVDSMLIPSMMLNATSSTADVDCLLYRYQVFDRFSGMSTPPGSGSTLTLTPDNEPDEEGGGLSDKKSLVSDVEAASTAAAILLRQQHQDEEELHQVGIYYPGKSSGIPRNPHKNVTKPKDLKNKRNGANLIAAAAGGHPKPSRSKSVEELRFKFWDWMGLRRNRQN